MTEQLTTVALTAEERRIISNLRDIPPSPLRDLSREVIIRLLEFVREPKCSEMQGDGVPCDRPEADCEQCTRLRQIVESLRDTLPSVV
jgi:hypothetical protein